MVLNTSRFGQLEIDSDTTITFTQPIIGFQDFRRFVLMPGPPESGVSWLQSAENGDLAFLLVDPRQVVQDYRVDLSQQELAELAVTSVNDLDVFTLLVIPADRAKVRTNLKAPILINRKHRLGKQTVLEKQDYPIQFFLAQAQQAPAKQEA